MSFQGICREAKCGISVPDPPVSYIKQQGIPRFQIALAVNIQYPLLKIWHENVQDGYIIYYIYIYIILTFSMAQFPYHSLELGERQVTLSKAG